MIIGSAFGMIDVCGNMARPRATSLPNEFWSDLAWMVAPNGRRHVVDEDGCGRFPL